MLLARGMVLRERWNAIGTVSVAVSFLRGAQDVASIVVAEFRGELVDRRYCGGKMPAERWEVHFFNFHNLYIKMLNTNVKYTCEF